MVSCFLRPFKMAASSQKPPCNHDEVNSIFLNAETVMFLHQIFLKGLTARMECWPTLVLGIRLFQNKGKLHNKTNKKRESNDNINACHPQCICLMHVIIRNCLHYFLLNSLFCNLKKNYFFGVMNSTLTIARVILSIVLLIIIFKLIVH